MNTTRHNLSMLPRDGLAMGDSYVGGGQKEFPVQDPDGVCPGSGGMGRMQLVNSDTFREDAGQEGSQ